VYDSLEDKVLMAMHTNNFLLVVCATFAVGSISAVCSTIVKDVGSSLEQKKKYESRLRNSVEIKKNNDSTFVRTSNVRLGPSPSINTKSKETEKFAVLKPVFPKYTTSAIEGGVLFASYQIMTKIVAMVVPEDFNMKFVFNQVIESIEREIDPDIV
jgi:hypothetical protein